MYLRVVRIGYYGYLVQQVNETATIQFVSLGELENEATDHQQTK